MLPSHNSCLTTNVRGPAVNFCEAGVICLGAPMSELHHRTTIAKVEGWAHATAMASARLSRRGPVVHPMFVSRTAQFDYSFANRSEPLHDAFRCMIVGPNEARSPRQGKVLEQPVAGGPRRFRREALPPVGSVERIRDLRLGPVERLEDADASDKDAIVDFFARPHPVAAQ